MRIKITLQSQDTYFEIAVIHLSFHHGDTEDTEEELGFVVRLVLITYRSYDATPGLRWPVLLQLCLPPTLL